MCDTNFVYLTTGRFERDNFRVGCRYRWEVDVAGKGTAVGTFRTEDRAPRLIRVPGVTNALAIRIESYVKSTGFTDADIVRLRALLTE